MFGKRLSEAVNAKGTPLVVGLDLDIAGFPPWLLPAEQQQRLSLGTVASLSADYGERVLSIVAPHVAVIKFQSACYERLGAAGITVLEKLLIRARKLGLLTILDGKRGDVPHTARLYAETYLGSVANTDDKTIRQTLPPAFHCDALTLHPYLGMDSLRPFIQAAAVHGKGIFVCVKTSNSGSGDFQDVPLAESESSATELLYERVAQALAKAQQQQAVHAPYHFIGIVAGATYPQAGARLRKLLPRACFLVPGWGAQGGDVSIFKAFSGELDGDCFRGVLFNVSRGILSPQDAAPTTRKEWEAMIEQRTLYYKKALAQQLSGF